MIAPDSTASEWLLRGKPCRGNQTYRDHGRENDGGGEGVFQAHSCDCCKGNGERPRNAAHAGKNLRRKAGHLPRQYRGEQKKHGEKKPERAEEVPISPGKSLRVKADRPH